MVAWEDVPDGALVRRAREEGGVFFYQRRGDRGWCVGGRTTEGDGYFEQMDDDGWPRPWAHNDRGRVTIVALGLAGQETADDLRRLAEVFEVREALRVLDTPWSLLYNHRTGEAHDLGTLAEQLHAAGWRPGMTADDAARLLAEVHHG